jgi:hypothetical protein
LTPPEDEAFKDNEQLKASFNPSYDSAKTYWYKWYKGADLNATTLITNGLVGYWPLNSDTSDYWGSKNGACANCPTQTAGKIGGAYQFDGVNDVVDLNLGGTSPFLNLNGTFENSSDWTWGGTWTWVPSKAHIAGYSGSYQWLDQTVPITAGSTYRLTLDIVTQSYADILYPVLGTDTLQISVDAPWTPRTVSYNMTAGSSHSKLRFMGWMQLSGTMEIDNVILEQTGSNTSSSMWIKPAGTNAWEHVAYDGTTYYKNGIAGTPTSYPLMGYFVGRNAATGTYFNGAIDEVMVFNRALSAAEIQQLYYGGLYDGNKMDSSRTAVGEQWKAGYRWNSLGGQNWSADANSQAVTITS